MKSFGLGLKIMLFTFLLLVITAGTLIYFSYKSAYTDLEKAVVQRLEGIANTGALMIDGDLHEQIKTSEDADTEAFRKLQKVLRDIKENNNINTPVYTFRQEGEKVKYIVMTQERAFIGDEHTIRPEMWPALREGKPSQTGIYEDVNGTWMTAFAPIFDSQRNNVGILNIDIKLETFQQELREKTQRLMVVSGIIVVLAILMSFILSRGLVKKLRYLSEITEKISTGMMDRSISIKSKDEVGDLAQSLERMRVSLKMAMEMIDEKEEEEQS
ncbi:MAG: HAMP domain-containing protein [bacterium]|nr:HAMP domain-containing protein [bacterium]